MSVWRDWHSFTCALAQQITPKNAAALGVPTYFNVVEVAMDYTTMKVRTAAVGVACRMLIPWFGADAGEGKQRPVHQRQRLCDGPEAYCCERACIQPRGKCHLPTR